MIDEEKIVDFYKKYSNEEIQKMLDDGIVKYNIIIQSEKIAKEYLRRYNVHFYYQNERFKNDFKRLLIGAKHRNLLFHEEYYHSDCHIEDVIERIIENKHKQLDALHEFAYQYIGYLGNDTWNNLADINDENGLYIKMNEINMLYERIIEDVKENCTKKQKVKTKYEDL